MGFKAIILAVLLVSTVYLDILAHAKYLLLQIDEVQPNPAPPLQPTPAPKPPSPSNVLEEGQRCGGRREVVHGISCGKGLKCVGTAVHWDGQGTCRRTGSNCPNNDAVGCREDPCDFATCSVDSATCVSNYCGACNAVFYDETGQNEVQCQDKCLVVRDRCRPWEESKKCCSGLTCKFGKGGYYCREEFKKDAKAPKGQKGTTGESQPTESMGMCTQSKTPCKYVGETYDPHCPKGHFCNIIDGPCGGFCMPRVTCAIDHDCPGCCVNGRCGECKG